MAAYVTIENRTSYSIFVRHGRHHLYINVVGDTVPEQITGDLMSMIYSTISNSPDFRATEVVRHHHTREQVIP